MSIANTKKGIARLVRHLKQSTPKLIVAEATGGYEEAVVLALFEAGLPVALVSPQRVRQYAEAKGLLAKTDPLDARLLAEYGKAIQPRLFVGKSEERKKLSALVGVAPMTKDSGEKRDYRKTQGGRPDVRRALYMATLTGIRYNAVLKPQYDQLVKRGKEKKVAITACMGKMLTILNAMMRDQQPFRM